jgi:hypothetical protein
MAVGPGDGGGISAAEAPSNAPPAPTPRAEPGPSVADDPQRGDAEAEPEPTADDGVSDDGVSDDGVSDDGVSDDDSAPQRGLDAAVDGAEEDAGRPLVESATPPVSDDAGVSVNPADTSTEPPACPEPSEFIEPRRLSETGLYADITTGTLAPGVFEFAPQYPLWTDGADKRRFGQLPRCSQIDTSDMDNWTYPQGTKLWKEFVRDNAAGNPVRVETRLMQKTTRTKWFMTAFIWNAEQTEATVGLDDSDDLLLLQENASGTEHDVPGRGACAKCHLGVWDKALGFSALQLSHEGQPGFMTLERLIDEEWLTDPPAAALVLPGDANQAAALGYLHANCGHCHNPNAETASLGLTLWAQSGQLVSVAESTAVTTTLGLDTQASQKPIGEPALRVVAGEPEQSALYWRMIQPAEFPGNPEGGVHMPLIGTEITDPVGVDLVARWIGSLGPGAR